jgi:hypothetical protein
MTPEQIQQYQINYGKIRKKWGDEGDSDDE